MYLLLYSLKLRLTPLPLQLTLLHHLVPLRLPPYGLRQHIRTEQLHDIVEDARVQGLDELDVGGDFYVGGFLGLAGRGDGEVLCEVPHRPDQHQRVRDAGGRPFDHMAAPVVKSGAGVCAPGVLLC